MHKLTVLAIVFAAFACVAHVAQADILDSLSKGLENVKDVVNEKVKSATENSVLDVCITNDNCNKSFFKLRNYCCGMQCCDWFTYVFRDK